VGSDRYLFDNRADEAGDRFDGLAALFNPTTFGHFDRLGVGPGWRCWEVGVGGPSVARWLADRVGPTGHVLATDIETSWAEPVDRANVEVRRHDVVTEPAPDGGFDLIHARLVLIHLPAREEVLTKLAGALRPGGWLVIQDYDSTLQPYASPDAVNDDEHLANEVRAAMRVLLSDHGADMAWGRRLPRQLRAAGLVDVGADGFLSIATPAAIALDQANTSQTRAEAVHKGLLTDEQIDRYLAALDAGTVDVATAPLVSAWGRRASG
jgi:SAM-dependent methyltransferase